MEKRSIQVLHAYLMKNKYKKELTRHTNHFFACCDTGWFYDREQNWIEETQASERLSNELTEFLRGMAASFSNVQPVSLVTVDDPV